MKERRMAQVTDIFPDYSSALAACGPGYNDADIANVIAYKASLAVDSRRFPPEQALNSVLAVGIAAAEITERPLTVLDFGGGCGFHYFRVAAAMRSQLRWAIVETSIMAERAAKLALNRFEVFTDIAVAAAALRRIHLIHASSSIQYVPEPIPTLQALARLQARYFTLARFPVWSRDQLVGIQVSALAENGIGPMPPTIADRQVRYPVTFTSFDEVMQIFSNYEIAMVRGSPSSTYTIRGEQVQGINLIFRLKNSLD
jgi:putative methyltransferase (TIGR04325 family)